MKKTYSGKPRGIMVLTSIYSIIMLTIMILSISLIIKKQKPDTVTEIIKKEKEYVYVRTNDDSTDSIYADTASVEQLYVVREYMGMIGIFSSKGELVKSIEVNINTLPEADRRLLGEGFEIIGKKQLNAIIEDYTG